MIDEDRLDLALWIEQGFACASNILDEWMFPTKQIGMTIKEFRFKYQIQDSVESCLYDDNNLEIILNDMLGFDEKDFCFFKKYLKKQKIS